MTNTQDIQDIADAIANTTIPAPTRSGLCASCGTMVYDEDADAQICLPCKRDIEE